VKLLTIENRKPLLWIGIALLFVVALSVLYVFAPTTPTYGFQATLAIEIRLLLIVLLSTLAAMYFWATKEIVSSFRWLFIAPVVTGIGAIVLFLIGTLAV
jgi:uncharacterized BrkB/YihY/UPF0761 family membrane protein